VDAEEFLGLYLDVLDYELAELPAYISKLESASASSVEELEEEPRLVEVAKRDSTVRDLLFLSLLRA
jgi:hypothetical protein